MRRQGGGWRGTKGALVVLSGLVLSPVLGTSLAHAQKPDEEIAPEILAPQLLSPPEVPYPEGAEGAAVVALKILVTASGAVGDVQVVEGAAPFALAAREAARKFTFTPASQGGEARAAWILFRIEFEPPVLEEPPPSPSPPPMPGEPAADAEEEPTQQTVQVQGMRRPGVGRVMSDAETQIIPGAEGDPVRAIEAMPGTVPVLASGPFIGLRGASPGMVGYEYDGISLPYLFHLARGPAVVHPWMVESAAIHSGGAPARLGRAGGGFVEANAAHPAGRKRAAARLRATDAALGAEAPFAEGRGSVLVAGRYSYTKPLVSLIAPEFSLNYWDYQARVRYALTPHDEVEVVSFGAGDRSSVILEGEPRDDLFYGSLHRASLRYTRYREGGAHHRIAVTVGHDRWDGEPSLIRPFLYTVNLTASSTQPVSRRSWVEVGADVGVRFQTDYYYDPGPQTAAPEEYSRDDVMAGTWLDWTFAANEQTTLAAGVRVDLYSSSATPLHEDATAGAVQPRLSLSHQAHERVRLHNSVGILSQPRSPAQRPPGRVGSTDGGLETAALTDAGAELSLPAGVTFDTTVFHNAFFNVGDAEHLIYLYDQAPDLKRATGHAFGVELSLRRMLAERLRGFVSYTFSRSERSIGRVHGLTEFDRPHVADVALAYYLGQGWTFSSRGTYYRGFPAQVTRVDYVPIAPRASDHYQVDWQLAKRWDIGPDQGWWGVTFGVLNTTLRSEANDYFCDDALRCEEELVGPATIPTFGVEGEI